MRFAIQLAVFLFLSALVLGSKFAGHILAGMVRS